MRLLIFLSLLFAGCAHRPSDTLMHVLARDFTAPWIEPDIAYWTANFSSHPTNHFYVGATEIRDTRLTRGLVYWKEERTIIFVEEPNVEEAHCLTWRHPLKLDRDTVDRHEDIGGSTYLETHRTWITWMEECISRGKLYTVSLDEARRRYPFASTPEGALTSGSSQ